MKYQILCNAVIMGVTLSSLVASETEREVDSIFVYPFYKDMPILVESQGIDDQHNAEGELVLDSEPILDLCELDEICVSCDVPKEEQVCDEDGNCCCCQPANGDEDLSAVAPISGFASGGTGSGGVGFSFFGGGFVTGLGGFATTSANSETSTTNSSITGSPVTPTVSNVRDRVSSVVAVPEPSTWMMLGTLLLVLTFIGVKNRSLQKK